MKKLLITLGLVFLMMRLASAQVTTGEPAKDFMAKDTNGVEQTLSSYKGKYVVLEWFNYGCPFVKKHYDSNNMQSLQKELTGKGIVWLSINSSAQGKEGYTTSDEANALTKEKGALPTAVILDSDGKIGKMYGAQTTPHMFVINPEGVIIYQGAIDSTPSADSADIATSTNYVRTALDEAMSGKPVSNATTKSYGCSVKY
jgi:peroxiredoxin